MRGFFQLTSRILNYKLARAGLLSPSLPINLTFSVTNQCQSKCKTCNIWKIYNNRKPPHGEELELSEIQKIFESIGKTFFFNISGGCPFLREDLPEIISIACKYLKPAIIHIPTNAVEPELVERGMLKILEIMEKMDKKIELSIKPSFDGVGETHDEIRGIKGNFENVNLLLIKLFKLREKHSNLKVGLNTIVSRMNVKRVNETVEFVDKLPVDSYILEIAEKRAEMKNEEENIIPDFEDYTEAINLFIEKSLLRIPRLPLLGKITECLRLIYYKNSIEIIKRGKQVLPCYGGISNAHISSNGNVWPCAVLGEGMSLGNLREADYDFKKIWNSKKAREIRKIIKSGGCYCPLANQAYSNILLSAGELSKAIKYFCVSLLK